MESDERLFSLSEFSVKGMNSSALASGWWNEHRLMNHKDLKFKKVDCNEDESGRVGSGGASNKSELAWARRKGKGVAVDSEGDVGLESVRVQSMLKGPDFVGCDSVQ